MNTQAKPPKPTLSHPCRETCSGYRQAFDEGKREALACDEVLAMRDALILLNLFIERIGMTDKLPTRKSYEAIREFEKLSGGGANAT